MSAKIEVVQERDSDFGVRVSEEKGETRHTVTLKETDYQRLTDGKIPRQELIRRSFEFLLDQEPKESILRSFDLMVISRYFPQYEREIRQRISA